MIDLGQMMVGMTMKIYERLWTAYMSQALSSSNGEVYNESSTFWIRHHGLHKKEKFGI